MILWSNGCSSGSATAAGKRQIIKDRISNRISGNNYYQTNNGINQRAFAFLIVSSFPFEVIHLKPAIIVKAKKMIPKSQELFGLKLK